MTSSCQAYAEADKLDISEFLSSTNSEYYQQDNLNFEPLVKGVVKRGGPYVKEITFGCRWLKISQGIIDHIAQHCQQLRRIDMGCTIINGSLTPILEKAVYRLTFFSLEEASWVEDKHASQIRAYMSQFKVIKNLNLRKAMFDLNVITDLPSTLQSLDISGTKQLSGNALAEFFKTHTNLKEFKMNPIPHALKMSYVYLLNNGEDPEEGGLQIAIDEITNLEKLELLDLGYIPHDAYSLNLHPISHLKNLKSLQFEACDCLTLASLQVLLTEMQDLENLILINCVKLGDYSPLGLLKNLKQLHVEKTIQVCDQDLEAVAFSNVNLEILKLRKCFNITNKGVRHAVSRCPLTELDLSMCENIDDNSLEIIVESSNKKCKIRTLALNTCSNITGKGLEKLASCPKVMSSLRSLDVTRNKYVDNNSIISLHGALLEQKSTNPASFEPLTCYVSHSGVSPDIEEFVKETVTLVF
ncbi:hypothetical protein FO519_000068 [Halicephalobus sp. NKZ332]|nr:hypothetical protein FO519_000068 [Halicephalobus sp. NKZ332]